MEGNIPFGGKELKKLWEKRLSIPPKRFGDGYPRATPVPGLRLALRKSPSKYFNTFALRHKRAGQKKRAAWFQLGEAAHEFPGTSFKLEPFI
ncbi:MAG: hypothetical protein ACXVB9_07665 [Bdellovibrionota bacterium]